MINAKFYKNLEFWEIHHMVKGHAGQAKKGKDIVCAAASILTQTLAQVIHDHEDRLKGKPTINIESGDVVIKCRCADEWTFCKLVQAYDFVKRGYDLLAETYPQYVKIKRYIPNITE